MKEIVVELSKFKPVDERRKETWEKFQAGTLGGRLVRYHESEPYTIAFCYLPKVCLVVKGLAREVRFFVDNLPACSYYLSYWKQGKHRGYWKLNAKAHAMGIFLTHTGISNGRMGYHLFTSRGNPWTVEMRRVPRAYLKELAE